MLTVFHVLLIVLTTLIARFVIWCNRQNIRLVSGLPGPRGLPLLGIIITLMKNLKGLHKLALHYNAQYGPIFKVNAMGQIKVVLAGPEELEILLTNKDNITKDVGFKYLQPWLATGLLTATGNKWRSRRKMLTPAFGFNILEDFMPVFNENSAILVNKLRKHSSYVDIIPYITLFALDNICETTMGISVGAQSGGGDEYVKAVDRMCVLFVYRIVFPIFAFDWLYYCSPWGREEKKLLKVMKTFSGDVIKSKRLEQQNKRSSPDISNDKSKKRLSLLDILLEMSDEKGYLTEEDIREEVDTFMFAGHDTTGTAMCWTLYLLGRHQDIQEKLYSEVRDTLGPENRQPNISDVQNMTYMGKVIKEVLRLYPSVPAISRRLDTDITVDGYVIPAGMDVVLSPFVVHRNPKIYPDPEKFDPERFSPEQSAGRHPYAYIPFSAGPRNCIGQKFAGLELKSAVCSILQNFKLVSLPADEMSFVPGIVLRPHGQIRIKFSPRNV